MQLADAIELGALMKPQAFDPDSYPDKSCALQAACDALGENGHVYMNAIHRRYPWTFEKWGEEFSCPLCDRNDFGTKKVDVIWHMNDTHQVPRHLTAAWVRSVDPTEPKLLPAPKEGALINQREELQHV